MGAEGFQAGVLVPRERPFNGETWAQGIRVACYFWMQAPSLPLFVSRDSR